MRSRATNPFQLLKMTSTPEPIVRERYLSPPPETTILTAQTPCQHQVTKAVWAYIREASLQDPKDGRKIRNDEKMFPVFKCKTMNMMHIAKKLSPHLKKYSELVVGGDDGAATQGGKRGFLSRNSDAAPFRGAPLFLRV